MDETSIGFKDPEFLHIQASRLVNMAKNPHQNCRQARRKQERSLKKKKKIDPQVIAIGTIN